MSVSKVECLECRCELISRFSAIRAIGDLLNAAADSVNKGRNELHESTLSAIGIHLEELATEALVLLKYDNPKPKLQAAAD